MSRRTPCAEREVSIGNAISSADRNWLDTSPRTLTRSRIEASEIAPGPIASGGYPSFPRYRMSAPSARSVSTKSPIGRSCMRGTPASS